MPKAAWCWPTRSRSPRARQPGSDRRFRDAHRRVRQRADRSLQRRVHESTAVARSASSGRPRQRRARVAVSDGRGLRQRPRISIADVLQCTPDSKGDHILAARFLNRFVPAQVPWIHLDLAASNRSGGLGHVPTDFTGFGVRYARTAAGSRPVCWRTRPQALPRQPPADGATLAGQQHDEIADTRFARTTGTCTCATARSSPASCRSPRGSSRARSSCRTSSRR